MYKSPKVRMNVGRFKELKKGHVSGVWRPRLRVEKMILEILHALYIFQTSSKPLIFVLKWIEFTYRKETGIYKCDSHRTR